MRRFSFIAGQHHRFKSIDHSQSIDHSHSHADTDSYPDWNNHF